MITSHNKSVNVDRKKLIEVMQANLATHVKDFNEAVLGYKVKLLTDFQSAIIEVNGTKAEDLKSFRGVPAAFPQNYSSNYQEMIDMLEFSVDEVINLDQVSFRQFVKNEWSWSNSFNATATLYKEYATAAQLI